jgi:DivIVA domain-containing protein
MPLTPEDVANKQFTSTRLKPGYDETEVDEFLDEVEAELTRLYRENDELRSKLAAAGRAPAAEGAPAAAPVAPAAPDAALVRENEELRSKLDNVQRQLVEAQSRPAQQVAPAAAPAGQPQPSETATGILALAQRTADELIGEARTRAEQLKREAEDKHRQTIGTLETERSALERKVEQLRAFEREYRTRLKSYLEGQLRELEGRGTEAPSGSPGGAGGQGGQSGQGGQQPGQPARSPFTPGSPVGGETPGGPPQQPAPSGFALDEGSDQRH